MGPNTYSQSIWKTGDISDLSTSFFLIVGLRIPFPGALNEAGSWSIYLHLPTQNCRNYPVLKLNRPAPLSGPGIAFGKIFPNHTPKVTFLQVIFEVESRRSHQQGVLPDGTNCVKVVLQHSLAFFAFRGRSLPGSSQSPFQG